jgi:hypothetical protein
MSTFTVPLRFSSSLHSAFCILHSAFCITAKPHFGCQFMMMVIGLGSDTTAVTRKRWPSGDGS